MFVRFLFPDQTVKLWNFFTFCRVHRTDLITIYIDFIGTQSYPYGNDNIIFCVHPNKYYCLKYRRHNNY
jgi:hypothetical protein